MKILFISFFYNVIDSNTSGEVVTMTGVVV